MVDPSCDLHSDFLVLLEQIQPFETSIKQVKSCDLHSDFLVLLEQIQRFGFAMSRVTGCDLHSDFLVLLEQIQLRQCGSHRQSVVICIQIF